MSGSDPDGGLHPAACPDCYTDQQPGFEQPHERDCPRRVQSPDMSDPVAAIADAIDDADPERAVALLVELARVDPARAESVLEIMRLGIEVALARDAE